MRELINIINESQNNPLTNKKSMTLSEYINKQDIPEEKKMKLVEMSKGEVAKKIIEMNKDKKVGDIAANINGDEIKNSILLYISDSMFKAAIKKDDKIRILTYSSFLDSVEEETISVSELKLIEKLV